VARISDPAYLDALEADLAPAWETMQQALGAPATGVAPPWAHLRERQGQLAHSLNPPSPILAYLETPAAPPYDALRVEVENVLNLPVEIVGFDVNGATFLDADPGWVAEASREGLLAAAPTLSGPAVSGPPLPVLRAYDDGRVGCYVRFNVPLTAIHAVDEEVDFNQPPDLRVAVRILGGARIQMVPARVGIAEATSGEPGPE
jgi:hypothetical protein